MAIIYSYPQITPKAEDLLIISDVSDGQKPTKTASIADILSLASSGGGGLSGSGAAGQVTFWTSANGLSGSNSFFFDSSTSRVGLGTTAPLTPIHIQDGGFPQITIDQTDGITGSAIRFTQEITSQTNRPQLWNVGLSPNPTDGVFKISAAGFNGDFDAVTIRPNSAGVAAMLLSSTVAIDDTVYSQSNADAEASAALEVRSIDRGLLPPRMTSSQRIGISNPAAGLIVYDSDVNATYVYDGSNWVELGAGGGSGSDVYVSSILPDTLKIPFDIGGFEQGTTVSQLNNANRTFSEMFDVLLFPTIEPTFTNPFATLTSTGLQALYIIGSFQTFTLTTGANPGFLSNADGNPFGGYTAPAGPYAGQLLQAFITGATTPVLTRSGTPSQPVISNPTVSSYKVEQGPNTWTLNLNFDVGPIPLLFPSGAQDLTDQYLGGSASKSISFEGVFPYFLGRPSGANDYDGGTLASYLNAGTSINNGIQCNQNYDETDTIRHRIELPTGMVNGRTIQVWEFRTDTETYQNPNTFTWIETTVTRNIDAGGGVTVPGISYTRLTKNGPTTGPVNYRVVFV
ncbi:MAG: hypothetical protein GY920_09850 [Aliivibrio sp.]|nr:hypothetical protein [Aliivibrio sp.]